LNLKTGGAEKMIGYCGYNCYLCPARSDDPAIRQKLVEGWRKLYGHQNYTVDNVKCDGCPSNGEVADKECKARPCAKEKGIKSCAYCGDFPCDKLRHLINPIFYATEEEYNLCIRQFEDGKNNLIKILIERGRTPPWLVQHSKA